MSLVLLLLFFFWNSGITAEPRPDSFAMEVPPARLLPRDAPRTASLTHFQAQEPPNWNTQPSGTRGDPGSQLLSLSLHLLQCGCVLPSQMGFFLKSQVVVQSLYVPPPHSHPPKLPRRGGRTAVPKQFTGVTSSKTLVPGKSKLGVEL